MLELHTTPLMWATILLLSFVCLWWFIVEWGFKKPTTHTSTTPNNKPIIKHVHAARLNTSQQLEAKERRTETRTNVKTSVEGKQHSKANSKSQKPIRTRSNSAHTTRNRKSNSHSGTANTTYISGTASDAKTIDRQASSPGKEGKDDKTGPTGTVKVNKTIPGATRSCMSPNPTKEHNGYGNQQTQKSVANTPKATVQQTGLPAGQPRRPETQSHKTSAEFQEQQSQSSNQPTLQAKEPVNPKRTHSATATTNVDNKVNTIEPQAGVPKAGTTDNVKCNTTASQVTHHNDKSSGAITATKLHQVESNQTQPACEKTKQPSYQSTRLNKQSVNATSSKAAVDANNIANQKPPAKLKTHTGETELDKQPAAPTTPKYQTAAKARHPSSRSEASLQIPTPTTHSIDSNQVLPHAAATLAGSIKPTTEYKPQPNTKTNQNSSATSPIPFKKIQTRSTHRKQSSIEVAVAQQITEPQSQSSQTHRSVSINEASTTSSFSAKVSNDLVAKNSETDSHSAKPVDAIPAIDTDASLRAQLAASERQIKSLQSTLNSVQDDLPTMAVPATRTHLQHSRPSLLSKVRVLDQPKV